MSQYFWTSTKAKLLDKARDPAFWIVAINMSDLVATFLRFQNLVDAHQVCKNIWPHHFCMSRSQCLISFRSATCSYCACRCVCRLIVSDKAWSVVDSDGWHFIHKMESWVALDVIHSFDLHPVLHLSNDRPRLVNVGLNLLSCESFGPHFGDQHRWASKPSCAHFIIRLIYIDTELVPHLDMLNGKVCNFLRDLSAA